MDFQTINATSLTKTPPNDNEAERALLCSLLLAPKRLPDIADISADDFYTPTHQLFVAAICTIIKTRAADELDLLVLRAEAEKAGLVARVIHADQLLEETLQTFGIEARVTDTSRREIVASDSARFSFERYPVNIE